MSGVQTCCYKQFLLEKYGSCATSASYTLLNVSDGLLCPHSVINEILKNGYITCRTEFGWICVACFNNTWPH